MNGTRFLPQKPGRVLALTCLTCLRIGTLLCLPAGIVDAADQVSIDEQLSEGIILDASATVFGTATPNTDNGGPNLTLSIGGSDFSIDVVNGTWRKEQVALQVGPNVITVRHGAASQMIIVTRGTNLAARPTQRVKVDWSQRADDELRQIARETLNPSPNAAQLTSFVNGVHLETEALIRRSYDGIADVELVNAPGNNVHTIAMKPDFGPIFGRSLYDCGNSDLQQISEIWLGTFRRSMLRSFAPGGDESVDWAPMKRSDSLQTRIDDVAHALARTAAHELGHSLGLVGSRDACSWMRGCSDGHNCDQFDIDFPVADRFAKGRYIMDPGDKTDNIARLGEASTLARSRERQSARFNTFNRSYLAIIHPPRP